MLVSCEKHESAPSGGFGKRLANRYDQNIINARHRLIEQENRCT